MSAELLDGKKIAAEIRAEVKKEVEEEESVEKAISQKGKSKKVGCSIGFTYVLSPFHTKKQKQ